MTIKIGDKEYTIEFTIEASLYNDCTEKVVGLISSVAGDNDLASVIETMSDVPQTTLTMFYAGLLEHHGEDGDGTVKSKTDAKRLIKKYFEEHKEDETGNFHGMMGLLLDQMMNDGFFKQIGLVQMMENASQALAEKTPKKPQDHQKKQPSKKVTEK